MEKEKMKAKFIEKSINKHGEIYDYTKVEYINSQTKVCIICPEHGEFWQTPSAHVRGNGCPVCANIKRGNTLRWDKEQFLVRANEKHGNKYDYSKVEYINSNTVVCIVCPEHGEFWQTPSAHMNGQGCPKCSHRGLTVEEVVSEFIKIHGNKYQYHVETIGKLNDKCKITCPVHGDFMQSPTKHLKGQGCPKCHTEKRSMAFDEFVKKANELHNNRYCYEMGGYDGYNSYVNVICPKHGAFVQNVTNHLQGCGCPKCSNNISKPEGEIVQFIENELGFCVDVHNRDVIKPHELDIFIPSKMVAIEYDGLRWHSEEFNKDKNYHLNKSIECEKRSIRLIHIFEDEWLYKKEIVKSRLKNILGKTGCVLYARECDVMKIETTEGKAFLEQNHIQGSSVSSIYYGLVHDGELVAVMSFSKPRVNLNNRGVNDDEYELLRFCNKIDTAVVGGAGKLLKAFIKDFKPKKIKSYCDKRWSDGNLYFKLGFIHLHDSKPNYYYIVKNVRENRFKYRKDVLVRKYNCPDNMSEHEFCKSHGWYRIYDCGTKVFLLNVG